MGFLSAFFPGGKVKEAIAEPAKPDRFTICVTFVLKHEGGYVLNKNDPGGATNKGITLRVLSAWRGKLCTVSDVAALTTPEAEAIYRARYWNLIHGDKLPPGLDLAVFDAAVNSGPGQAAKWLQMAVGSVPDGAIGPATLTAVAAKDPVAVAHTVCQLRLAMLKTLPTWPVFGRGWAKRVAEVEAQFLG